MNERPKGKSIGRRAVAKAPAKPVKPATKAGAAAPASPATGAAPRGKGARKAGAAEKNPISLRPAERALLDALAARTHLSHSEVVARALQSYAAAVAPELRSAPPREENATDGDGERLFLSVDGRPEIEIVQPEFVLGSGEGVDLRLDLPLIAPRHARILLRDGRHLFEDLNSGKGSYRQGALLDVRFLEDGDEIDLGGFLPIRFRVERGAAGV